VPLKWPGSRKAATKKKIFVRINRLVIIGIQLY
jgi:hypothetical protein